MYFMSRLSLFLTSATVLGLSGLWSGSWVIDRHNIHHKNDSHIHSFIQESNKHTRERRRHALKHFQELLNSRRNDKQGGGVNERKKDVSPRDSRIVGRNGDKQQQQSLRINKGMVKKKRAPLERKKIQGRSIARLNKNTVVNSTTLSVIPDKNSNSSHYEKATPTKRRNTTNSTATDMQGMTSVKTRIRGKSLGVEESLNVTSTNTISAKIEPKQHAALIPPHHYRNASLPVAAEGNIIWMIGNHSNSTIKKNDTKVLARNTSTFNADKKLNTTAASNPSHNNSTNVTMNIPHYLLKEPTHHACDGYRGVLLIQSGDLGAAAGTAFFQYVINQISYAERYHLLPWIHFNNVSQHVYDPLVHGGVNTTVKCKDGMEIPFVDVRAPNGTKLTGLRGMHFPGRPRSAKGTPKDTTITVSGNGVWTSYFEPVSDFRKGDKSCEALPIINMTYHHLRSMHLYAPWAVRSWQYIDMPPHYFVGENQTLHEWFAPMRRNANDVVRKYFRFQPHIVDAVDRVLPENKTCLGLHIRHSDKWGARRQIPEKEFLPYVESFLENGGDTIYLATDSQNVIDTVRNKWPTHVREHVITQGDDSVVRSKWEKPVFKQGAHHRTNTEVLIEILALSRCRWMVHGLSAVSESAIYLNLDLHRRSVNLEDESHMPPRAFGDMVKKDLDGKRQVRKRKQSKH